MRLQVDTSCTQRREPQPRVVSHGRYPVKKLVEGQCIRFHTKNYGCEVIMRIRNLAWFERMVIISGDVMNDVAFGAGEYVELVTVEEAQHGS